MIEIPNFSDFSKKSRKIRSISSKMPIFDRFLKAISMPKIIGKAIYLNVKERDRF